MLTTNQHIGFGVQGKHAQAAYITSSNDTSLTTGTNNATFSAVNLGIPVPNRIVAVAIAAAIVTVTTASFTINSVTIGGISAVIVANKSQNNSSGGGNVAASCIAYIEESTLASGNIVVNYTYAETGTITNKDLTISVYNITDQVNTIPFDSQSNAATSGTSLAQNISVPLLGCVLGAASVAGVGTGITFTNLTEDTSAGETVLTGHNNTASVGTLSVAVNAPTMLATTLSLASWQ